jgi:hypothetical protein
MNSSHPLAAGLRSLPEKGKQSFARSEPKSIWYELVFYTAQVDSVHTITNKQYLGLICATNQH